MRTVFLIDGFNLYHSVKDVLHEGLAEPPLKWLDIPGLCESIVKDSPDLPRTARIEGIRYFSALSTHMEAR